MMADRFDLLAGKKKRKGYIKTIAWPLDRFHSGM